MSLLDNASNYLFGCVIQKRNLAQWFTLVSKCDMKTLRGPENCTEFRLVSKIVRKISLIIMIISFHEFFGLDFFTFSGSLCEIDTEELAHFLLYLLLAGLHLATEACKNFWATSLSTILQIHDDLKIDSPTKQYIIIHFKNSIYFHALPSKLVLLIFWMENPLKKLQSKIHIPYHIHKYARPK